MLTSVNVTLNWNLPVLPSPNWKAEPNNSPSQLKDLTNSLLKRIKKLTDSVKKMVISKLTSVNLVSTKMKFYVYVVKSKNKEDSSTKRKPSSSNLDPSKTSSLNVKETMLNYVLVLNNYLVNTMMNKLRDLVSMPMLIKLLVKRLSLNNKSPN